LMRGETISKVIFLLCLFVGSSWAQSQQGFVGLAVGDIPPVARGQGISGALVQNLAPGGPAEAAGIQRNDIIIAINHTAVSGPQAVTQMASTLAPGLHVPIDLLRWNGASIEKLTVTITVGTWSASAGPSRPASPSRSEQSIDPRQPSNPAPNMQPHDQPEVLPSGIKFTHLTDPLEHAFTLDVPEGWRSEAGLARFSIIQINPYVRTLSPDKMTYLLLGEPNMPTYAPPSEMGLRLGYREGTLYSPGLGQRVLVMHYLPGTEFAKTYGQIALGSLCPALKFVSVQERPDLARKADSALPTVIPSRATGGEAWFTCTHNKQDMDAKIEAVTRITRDNIGWAVIWLGALITPKGQMDRSHAILTHVVGSMVWDPKWIQMQNSLSQQAAQITAQQIAESERKEAAFIGKLNSVDENFAAVDEIITGNSHYHDSQSGQDYYLNNLNPFKWIDDNGRIVGTESNTKPPFGYDYRSLTHVVQ
jgi:hypothetical protein